MLTDIDFALLTSYLLTYLLTDCEKKNILRIGIPFYFIVTRVRSMGNSRKKYLIEFFFVLNWKYKAK